MRRLGAGELNGRVMMSGLAADRDSAAVDGSTVTPMPEATICLMVSSELPEILGVSDRILVMRGGAIVSEVPREEASEAGLLRLALPVETTPAHA